MLVTQTAPAGSEGQNWKIPGQSCLSGFTADQNLYLSANLQGLRFQTSFDNLLYCPEIFFCTIKLTPSIVWICLLRIRCAVFVFQACHALLCLTWELQPWVLLVTSGDAQASSPPYSFSLHCADPYEHWGNAVGFDSLPAVRAYSTTQSYSYL